MPAIYFSLTTFNIFSLTSIHAGTYWTSWIYGLVYLINSGKNLAIFSLNFASSPFYLLDPSVALLNIGQTFMQNLLCLLLYLASFSIFWSLHAFDPSFIHWFFLLLHLNCQWTHLLIFLILVAISFQYYNFYFVLSQISYIIFYIFRLPLKFSSLIFISLN